MDANLDQSGLNLETKLLTGDIKTQKKIGTGYFEAACTLSILLFIGMAVILGLTLMDIDKCEKNQSPHCPYFTNPQPGKGAKDNLADYYTYAVIPDKSRILINPDPYPKKK